MQGRQPSRAEKVEWFMKDVRVVRRQKTTFNFLLLRTLIGTIALTFPFLTWWLANVRFEVGVPMSISVTYHLGSRDAFVGLLFVVSAFLFAYNGRYNEAKPERQKEQSRLSKAAAMFAVIVALVPTSCDLKWVKDVTGTNFDTCYAGYWNNGFPSAYLHMGAAILLFAILTLFCLRYFQQGTEGQTGKKGRRSKVYKVCGWTMVLAMVYGGVSFLTAEESVVSKNMFYVELVCLVAFGIAWLVAGKQIGYFASKREKFGLDR